MVLDPSLCGEGGREVLVPAPCGFAEAVEVDVKLQYVVFWYALHALWYAQEDRGLTGREVGVQVGAYDVGLELSRTPCARPSWTE